MPLQPFSLSRRRFIGGVAAATPALLAGGRVAARDASGPQVRLGIIGTGGRGTWIGNLFQKHGGYRITALADYFRDRVDAAGDKFDVPPERRFTGLSGYLRLLEAGELDAVAIETPPCFHPKQAAAAVRAGKHVYLAKPIAVDVPGCLSIEESGKRAAGKGLCFLVDFQTRATGSFIEAIQRVHAGAIGTFAFGECSYHAGRLGAHPTDGLSPQEGRLRNWVFDQALSGDIITEQNIHTLDVMSWIMNVPPLRATGTGGRKVRTDVGDCWDHFALVYEYPDQVGITFSSRQFNAQGSQPDGIRNRMFGDRGTLETQYGGQVLVRAREMYKGQSPGIFQAGAETNIADFHRAIAAGRTDISTVAPSVRSNLVTILGRVAAYTGSQVTWTDLLKERSPLDLRLDGLQA